MVNIMHGVDDEGLSLDFSAGLTLVELHLIENLKKGNFEEDSALREAFVGWVDGCMAEAAKDPTPNSNNAFLLKKAKVLIMAGMGEEAWTDLMDLRTLADNLGNQAMVDECNRLFLAIAEG